MPLLALLLVREGVPVLIQGRHDFDARVSPFELLAALDVVPAINADAASSQLAKSGLSCIQLERLLPGMADLLALRVRLGVRGSGHTMAKLLDPCIGRSLRLVAVTHPEYLERMHDFLLADGGYAMLLRGTEGEVYANPRRRPEMQAFRNGSMEIAWSAEGGGAPPLPSVPDVPIVAENAALIRPCMSAFVQACREAD